MTDATNQDGLAISLFSEVMAVEQNLRARLVQYLPKGLELSHFSVLNHLHHVDTERSPAELARAFNVTKGAMTNTITKLDAAGYIHVRPDWDDARKKCISISPAGRAKRDEALRAMSPMFDKVTRDFGDENLRKTLPMLRLLRQRTR